LLALLPSSSPFFYGRGKEKTRTEERDTKGRTEKGREEMSLVPVERKSGRKRSLNENERARLKREKEKADWHKRNPGSKWNNR
jgi:hypothetical protein